MNKYQRIIMWEKVKQDYNENIWQERIRKESRAWLELISIIWDIEQTCWLTYYIHNKLSIKDFHSCS